MRIALVLHKYGVRLDDPCSYPLGYMYISAVLKQAGHEVMVFNRNLEDSDVSNYDNSDAVLFTGYEEFLPYIKRDAAICRERGIKTIIGGALATFKTEEMSKICDVVIVGEGETIICNAIKSKGVFYGKRPDLDSLPLPDYEGFGAREYHKRNGVKHVGILTSRGCPWSCKFCAQTCSFQYRDLAKVFEEIDIYRDKYQPDLIVFNDNTLNISKARFLQICKEMAAKNVKWSSSIRLDKLDEQTVSAAKNSGCISCVVGVESFNQSKLDKMNKKMTVDSIYKGLDLLEKYNIKYAANALMGFEGETYKDIMQEVKALPKQYKINPVLVQPFIGTHPIRRSISQMEITTLNRAFRFRAESRGMTVYKEIGC